MQKVEKPDKEEAYIFKEKLEPLMPGAKNVLETEHLKNRLQKSYQGTYPANPTRAENSSTWS